MSCSSLLQVEVAVLVHRGQVAVGVDDAEGVQGGDVGRPAGAFPRERLRVRHVQRVLELGIHRPAGALQVRVDAAAGVQGPQDHGREAGARGAGC